MGYAIQQSTASQPLVFLMTDTTGAPKTGLTCTVTLSKNGGSPASPAGAVTEVGGGLYKVAPNATDSSTAGPLVLHASATGASDTWECYPIVSYIPVSTLEASLSTTGLSNVLAMLAPIINGAAYRVEGPVIGTKAPTQDDPWVIGGMYNGRPYFVMPYNSTNDCAPLYIWWSIFDEQPSTAYRWILSEELGTCGTAYYASGTSYPTLPDLPDSMQNGDLWEPRGTATATCVHAGFGPARALAGFDGYIPTAHLLLNTQVSGYASGSLGGRAYGSLQSTDSRLPTAGHAAGAIGGLPVLDADLQVSAKATVSGIQIDTEALAAAIAAQLPAGISQQQVRDAMALALGGGVVAAAGSIDKKLDSAGSVVTVSGQTILVE